MVANSGKSPSIKLRQAVIGDAEMLHGAINRFAAVRGQAHKIASTVSDFRKHGFGKNPKFSALIAESGGRFAGLCLYFPVFSTWTGRPGVFVQDLYIEETFRGMGIGETMLRRVAHKSARQGCTYLRLMVDVDNIAAQAFYKRVGVARMADEQEHGAHGEAFAALAAKPKRDNCT